MQKPRIALDIGSTVVKLATIDANDGILNQQQFPRDFDAGIPAQVGSILSMADGYTDGDDVLVCSSANGGLRVGILCLSEHFSGATLRDQVLLAGANPIFVYELDDVPLQTDSVDVLVIGGGIDHQDCEPMERRLKQLDLNRFNYGAMIYAGSRHLGSYIKGLNKDTLVVVNPLASSLQSECNSVFEAIRDAYLNDLIYKEGVSELPQSLSKNIRPTPEVVNRGFQRVISNRSSMSVSGATIVVDIGGATTDLHYSVEIVRNDSVHRPSAGVSVGRYVFTDLGIVASRDSTFMQMRNHPRIYEFLMSILPGEIREHYRQIREGDYNPDPTMLAYGCLFIAMDRFASGRGPGLPSVNLSKIANVILTGGAAQQIDVQHAGKLLDLFSSNELVHPRIHIDKNYQLWVDGITWGYE